MTAMPFRLLAAGGANRIARRLVQPRAVLLMLHSVTADVAPDCFSPNRRWQVHVDQLEAAVRLLRAQGFRAASIDETLAANRGHRDDRLFCVTFDDGYRDNAELAWPLLRRLGVPMTLFATTGFVDRSEVAWWHVLETWIDSEERIAFEIAGERLRMHCRTLADKEAAFECATRLWQRAPQQERRRVLDELADRGREHYAAAAQQRFLTTESLGDLATESSVTIGSHGVSHAAFASLSDEELERELTDSANAIELYTGKRPRHIAYPHGQAQDAAAREAAAVAAAGYVSALTTRHGVISAQGEGNPFLLPRIPLFPQDTQHSLLCKLSGLTTWLSRLRHRGSDR